MRKLADKADRIHQQHFASMRERYRTADGIQRRKQLIHHINIRIGQTVEKRGLAGIGIAHQRNYRNSVLFTALPSKIALFFNLFQFTSEVSQTFADTAAIDFQFAFTGATRTNTAGQSAQHQPLPQQTLASVFELRHFYLQLAFTRVSAGSKDVQNQRSTVNNLDAEHFFKILLHHAGEFLVEDHQISLHRLYAKAKLLRLASTDAESRVRLGTLLQNTQDGFSACSFSKLLQFCQ